MNKKSLLIGIVIGIIVASTVGVTATVLYSASEIGFTPTNPNWQVNNIQSAINDLYAAKNEQSVGGSSNYSTTEQIVGTWVDGKPIYQVSLKFNSSLSISANSGWKDVPVNAPNDCDRIIQGFLYRDEHTGVVYPWGITYIDNKIKINNGAVASTFNTDSYITIQYTKLDNNNEGE